LSIIRGTRGEQGIQGIISRDQKSSEVHEEFTGDVEEHQKEVNAGETEDGVDLRNGGLALEIVEHGVFREL
jgi:hypothetical protein